MLLQFFLRRKFAIAQITNCTAPTHSEWTHGQTKQLLLFDHLTGRAAASLDGLSGATIGAVSFFTLKFVTSNLKSACIKPQQHAQPLKASLPDSP